MPNRLSAIIAGSLWRAGNNCENLRNEVRESSQNALGIL